MDLGLNGKVAVVTGGSKGIGYATAEAFLKEGASVAICSRKKEELEEAGILEDISHMPARVKCAVLGWRTMDEIFKDADEGKIDKYSGKFD